MVQQGPHDPAEREQSNPDRITNMCTNRRGQRTGFQFHLRLMYIEIEFHENAN